MAAEAEHYAVLSAACVSQVGPSSQHPTILLSEARQRPACSSTGQRAPQRYPKRRAGHAGTRQVSGCSAASPPGTGRAPAGLLDGSPLWAQRAWNRQACYNLHFGANNESLRCFWPNRWFRLNSKHATCLLTPIFRQNCCHGFLPRRFKSRSQLWCRGAVLFLLSAGPASAAARCCRRREAKILLGTCVLLTSKRLKTAEKKISLLYCRKVTGGLI